MSCVRTRTRSYSGFPAYSLWSGSLPWRCHRLVRLPRSQCPAHDALGFARKSAHGVRPPEYGLGGAASPPSAGGLYFCAAGDVLDGDRRLVCVSLPLCATDRVNVWTVFRELTMGFARVSRRTRRSSRTGSTMFERDLRYWAKGRWVCQRVTSFARRV